jgi:hypothetical protein
MLVTTKAALVWSESPAGGALATSVSYSGTGCHSFRVAENIASTHLIVVWALRKTILAGIHCHHS